MTREQAIADEVAARYRCPAPASAVQIIATGETGLPKPWEQGPSWKDMINAKYRGLARAKRLAEVKPQRPEPVKIDGEAPGDTLRRMLDDGSTYAMIGEVLSISAVAALKRARRLGLRSLNKRGAKA